MPTLAVTARGQVTLRKSVLEHLGVRPGDRIDVELLPQGRAEVRAARPEGSLRDLYGMFAGRVARPATLEQIDQAIADGWAGRHDHG